MLSPVHTGTDQEDRLARCMRPWAGQRPERSVESRLRVWDVIAAVSVADGKRGGVLTSEYIQDRLCVTVAVFGSKHTLQEHCNRIDHAPNTRF